MYSIGNRPNESPHFGLSNALEQQQLQPQYKRQLPVDLTEEELIKEAAKVLAQSERIKCTADTPDTLAGIRHQEKLLDGKWAKVNWDFILNLISFFLLRCVALFENLFAHIR